MDIWEVLEWKSKFKEAGSRKEALIKYAGLTCSHFKKMAQEHIAHFIMEEWEFISGYEENQWVNPENIVGTHYDDYSNISLLEVLDRLQRFEENLAKYLINPDYYISNKYRTQSEQRLTLIFREEDQKYYINADGNNRFFLAKILGLKKVLVNRVSICRTDYQFKNALAKLKKCSFSWEMKLHKLVIYPLVGEPIEFTGAYKEQLYQFLYCYELMIGSKLEWIGHKLRKLFVKLFPFQTRKWDYIDWLFFQRYEQLRKHKLLERSD